MPPAAATTGEAAYARRLLFLFSLAYFAQGIGQHVGLVAQPLRFFFKETLGLDPAQTTEFLAILTIPWTLKPLYGLVSDFVPLLGYRRKTWLLATNALAALGFLWLAGLTEPRAIVAALLISAFGTAASDVIIDSVMVENGKRTGMTAVFQSAQWTWINVASVAASLLGGWLCTVLQPGTALHVAALVTLAAPLALMAASWAVVREERTQIRLAEMRATSVSLMAAFRSRTLWAVIAFLGFWYFSPGFGSTWYYHQVDKLQFTQGFIGVLGAVQSGASVIGALAYGRYVAQQPVRQQLSAGILAGTAATLSYLALLQPSGLAPAIAVAIAVVTGIATMIALLATLTLAAQACPSKAEGFTFAAIMAVVNASEQIAEIVGARLYTYVFQSMLPLILVSAAFTLSCFLLLPILRRFAEAK